MPEDEPFIRALLAAPDDTTTRLVYADWLDDRGDPRAEYLRLQVLMAETDNEANRLSTRDRLREFQSRFPSWWLAAVGFRAVGQASDRGRIAEAAELLGRPVESTVDGHRVAIEAAAVSGLTDAVAFLESWSMFNDDDIKYYFHLTARDGRETSCELQMYDPHFPCGPEFLEWYGAAALVIYRGSQYRLSACRLGFDGRPVDSELARGYCQWVINGRELGLRRHHGSEIHRVSVPDLDELPPLSLMQAVTRGLLPPP